MTAQENATKAILQAFFVASTDSSILKLVKGPKKGYFAGDENFCYFSSDFDGFLIRFVSMRAFGSMSTNRFSLSLTVFQITGIKGWKNQFCMIWKTFYFLSDFDIFFKSPMKNATHFLEFEDQESQKEH